MTRRIIYFVKFQILLYMVFQFESYLENLIIISPYDTILQSLMSVADFLFKSVLNLSTISINMDFDPDVGACSSFNLFVFGF